MSAPAETGSPGARLGVTGPKETRAGPLAAAESMLPDPRRLRQSLDPVAQGEGAARRLAHLPGRAVAVDHAGERRARRAVSTLAARAHGLVVHRAGPAVAEVLPGVGGDDRRVRRGARGRAG